MKTLRIWSSLAKIVTNSFEIEKLHPKILHTLPHNMRGLEGEADAQQ